MITGLSPAIGVPGAAGGSTGPSRIGPEPHPRSIEVSIRLPSANSYSAVERMGEDAARRVPAISKLSIFKSCLSVPASRCRFGAAAGS